MALPANSRITLEGLPGANATRVDRLLGGPFNGRLLTFPNNYYTKLEILERDKHSSLFGVFISGERKTL